MATRKRACNSFIAPVQFAAKRGFRNNPSKEAQDEKKFFGNYKVCINSCAGGYGDF
jgi:hypothetical protein